MQIERTVKTASYLVEALSSNYETSIFISELGKLLSRGIRLKHTGAQEP